MNKSSKFDREQEIRCLNKMLALKTQASEEGADSSFANEFKLLESITRKLNISEGFIVDVAASDGFTQSSTLGFFKMGWKGLAVEMHPLKFATLAYLYQDFPNARLARSRVTPGNINMLLQAFQTPLDFTILTLI